MKNQNILKRLANVDPFLAIPILLLLAIGTVMVYSASSVFAQENYHDGMYFFKKHLIWLFLGGFVMGAGVVMPVKWWQKFSVIGLGLGALLLVLTIAKGVKSHNATRWLRIGPIAIQASELMKPILLIFVASYLARKQERLQSFQKGLLPLLLSVGVVLGLILKQPDFGTMVTLGTTVLVMMFAGGARLTHLGAMGALAGVGAYALMMGAAYRRKRLLAFMDPWLDPQGSGFQIIQSFLAFKRGGLQGQGLGDSSQKLLFLPEAHTDFIFSIIAEELGFWGTLVVIMLFLCIVIQGFRLALRVKDTFAFILAVGITTLIGLQALLNMSVVMALLPTKGLTLPFVSYGGSSLLSMMFCASLLLGMSSSVAISGRMARRTMS